MLARLSVNLPNNILRSRVTDAFAPCSSCITYTKLSSTCLNSSSCSGGNDDANTTSASSCSRVVLTNSGYGSLRLGAGEAFAEILRQRIAQDFLDGTILLAA